MLMKCNVLVRYITYHRTASFSMHANKHDLRHTDISGCTQYRPFSNISKAAARSQTHFPFHLLVLWILNILLFLVSIFTGFYFHKFVFLQFQHRSWPP